MLFNEPKLLKLEQQRRRLRDQAFVVSVLFNEPKLLKFIDPTRFAQHPDVSVLFNEPKLLK